MSCLVLKGAVMTKSMKCPVFTPECDISEVRVRISKCTKTRTLCLICHSWVYLCKFTSWFWLYIVPSFNTFAQDRADHGIATKKGQMLLSKHHFLNLIWIKVGHNQSNLWSMGSNLDKKGPYFPWFMSSSKDMRSKRNMSELHLHQCSVCQGWTVVEKKVIHYSDMTVSINNMANLFPWSMKQI